MNANRSWRTLIAFALRVTVVHTLTYFLFGFLMSNIFDYSEIFKQEIIRDYMFPVQDHHVLAGPFLQPLRGLIFAIGLWPFRSLLIEKKRSWLILWGLLVTVGILSTPAASPGSIEGMLYTRLPLWYHLIGYPEILLQTLLFSIWLVWWERRSVQSYASTDRKENPLLAGLVNAIVAACFAFIGYAAGGLLLVAIANAKAGSGGAGIDVEAAGANFKTQFMFVVAFLINTPLAYWITRKVHQDQIALWTVFLLFWFIDAAVPWIYQTLVFGGSWIPGAVVLGFFPAVILATSIKLSTRRTIRQERSFV